MIDLGSCPVVEIGGGTCESPEAGRQPLGLSEEPRAGTCGGGSRFELPSPVEEILERTVESDLGASDGVLQCLEFLQQTRLRFEQRARALQVLLGKAVVKTLDLGETDPGANADLRSTVLPG